MFKSMGFPTHTRKGVGTMKKRIKKEKKKYPYKTGGRNRTSPNSSRNKGRIKENEKDMDKDN